MCTNVAVKHQSSKRHITGRSRVDLITEIQHRDYALTALTLQTLIMNVITSSPEVLYYFFINIIVIEVSLKIMDFPLQRYRRLANGTWSMSLDIQNTRQIECLRDAQHNWQGAHGTPPREYFKLLMIRKC